MNKHASSGSSIDPADYMKKNFLPDIVGNEMSIVTPVAGSLNKHR